MSTRRSNMGLNVGKALSGGLNAIGSGLNALTGVTSSSNQAFSQSKYLAGLSFNQQKWMASNAHQLEMQDLAKAGLNPALTTQSASAGSIASAGGTSNGGNTGTSAGVTPLSILDAINTTRQTNAQNNNLTAGAELQHAQAINIIEMLPISKREKEAYIKNLESGTWRNFNQALGYSESTSETSSYDRGSSTSAGGNAGKGIFTIGGNVSKSQNNARSTSKSHSKTW